MANITIFTITEFQELPERILSARQYQIITLVFIAISLFLAFAGILANSFNIRMFVAIGIKDGVTVSLLALAMSDLLYCAASVIFGTSWLFSEIEALHGVIFPINPFAVSMFIADIGLAWYTTTVLTTSYLAIARCMCVVKPLHFKNVFTKSRSIIIHVSFVLFAIAESIPVLSQMGTRRQFDRRANTTRIVLWFSHIREEIKDAVMLTFDTVFSFVTHILIIICVLVMAASLRKSANFRKAISSAKDKESDGKESEKKLSGKELQVVRQVVLISTIYIFCSLPKMGVAAYSLVEPDFDVGKRLHNFYLSLCYLRNISEILNSASTFLIYYNYNSAFRTLFQSKILGLQQQ